MGASQTVPAYSTIGSAIQNICYTGEQPGIQFIHTHSLDMATKFTHILSIQPRVFPLALREKGGEEALPGSYSAILNTEIEGINLEAVFNSSSVEASATIPFTDDINITLSATALPTYDLTLTTKLATNILHANLTANTEENFSNFQIGFDANVAVSNAILLGGKYLLDAESLKQHFEITTSAQTMRSLLSYNFNNTNKVSTLGFNYYLTDAASVGTKLQYDHSESIFVGSLGYNLAIGQNAINASISSDLTTCAKFMRDTGKGLSVSVGLTSNMIKAVNNLTLGLTLDTGSSI